MNFGKNVQILRKMANMTQEELAEKMNVSRQTVSKWELGTVLPEPEDDAIAHVEGWAKHLGAENPYIIGWDFPQVSQEQKNVFHMRGYGAALILANDQTPGNLDVEIKSQDRQNYITITLEEIPDAGEFALIPNAYKALLTYMAINGIKEKHDPGILSCYEHEYFDDNGIKFMDIYIAIE